MLVLSRHTIIGILWDLKYVKNTYCLTIKHSIAYIAIQVETFFKNK